MLLRIDQVWAVCYPARRGNGGLRHVVITANNQAGKAQLGRLHLLHKTCAGPISCRNTGLRGSGLFYVTATVYYVVSVPRNKTRVGH